MRKKLTIGLAVAIGSLLAAAPAAAITNGAPDGNRHPEVGALLAPQAFSDGTWAECSGTLVSPTVFLTAAHCDEGLSRVAVTFESSYVYPNGATFQGTWHADPLYNQSQSDPHDIAVVVLDKAVRGIAPARLPAAGSLSNLASNQQFTSAGYGAQAVNNGPGGKTYTYADIRFYATGTLNSTNSSWLRISQNASTGNGGTCYGDSGGPHFIDGAIVAVTVTGDAWCKSTDKDYRVDTAEAREFLANYVTLP